MSGFEKKFIVLYKVSGNTNVGFTMYVRSKYLRNPICFSDALKVAAEALVKVPKDYGVCGEVSVFIAEVTYQIKLPEVPVNVDIKPYKAEE